MTATLDPLAVFVPSRTPSACGRPAGWVEYTVQQRNSLYALAVNVGSTVAALRDVNCLALTENIAAGTTLFVPRAPVLPVATTTPAELGIGRILQTIGCTDPQARFISPLPLQPIRGVVDVVGSANIPDFALYQIEIRADAASQYQFYSDATQPVTDGVLTQLNADFFDPGLHWLKLTVVNRSGGALPTTTCEIPLIFD
jgi:LysM repeat protein